MVNWKKNLWILCIGIFIAQIAFSFAGPFIPMLLLEIGMEENVTLWSGILFSVSSLTFALMAPVWGWLSDRYGKRVMLIRSSFLMGLVYFLTGFVTNHIQLLWLRILNGLISGYNPAATMLIATNTPEAFLGYALGLLQTANALGSIMGPLVGGICGELVGIKQSYFLAAGILLVVTILSTFGVKEEIDRGKERSSMVKDISALIKNSSLMTVFASLLLVQAALLTIQPTLPLFISALVGEERAKVITGIVFSIIGISMALGAPLISRMRRLDYPSLFYISLIIGAFLTSLQGLANSIWYLGTLRFLFGFANAAITIAGNVLIAQSVDKSMRGSAFGLYNSIVSVGSVVGPLIGGFLGGRTGLRSSFYVSGLLFAIAAGVILVAKSKIKYGVKREEVSK